MTGFTIAPTPLLCFGPGTIAQLPSIVAQWGRQVLLITGKSSFENAPWKTKILELLHTCKVEH
ncbi:MAG: hypothetical protein ACP5PS_09785, partial [Bacteroidales bacterium]